VIGPALDQNVAGVHERSRFIADGEDFSLDDYGIIGWIGPVNSFMSLRGACDGLGSGIAQRGKSVFAFPFVGRKLNDAKYAACRWRRERDRNPIRLGLFDKVWRQPRKTATTTFKAPVAAGSVDVNARPASWIEAE
jgi:hypothetical protein